MTSRAGSFQNSKRIFLLFVDRHSKAGGWLSSSSSIFQADEGRLCPQTLYSVGDVINMKFFNDSENRDEHLIWSSLANCVTQRRSLDSPKVEIMKSVFISQGRDAECHANCRVLSKRWLPLIQEWSKTISIQGSGVPTHWRRFPKATRACVFKHDAAAW